MKYCTVATLVPRLLLLSFVTAGMVALLPAPALACSCGSEPSLEARTDAASIVFIGRMTAISENTLRPGQREVRFEVKRLFKDETGIVTNSVILYTARESSLCGSDFGRGVEYLIFADGNPARLTTGLCSGNKQLETATSEIQQLEARFAPPADLAATSIPTPTSSSQSLEPKVAN